MDSSNQKPASQVSYAGRDDAAIRNRPPWWRRRYVVNREFQLRFAWSAVLVGLVSSAVSSFMILLAFWSFNIWQGQRLPLPVMLTILFVMFTNVAGIYVVAVLTTQRVAGPLYNLARQIEEIGKFRFEARARFRKRDELQYIADRFNNMAKNLEIRDERCAGEFTRIQYELARLAEGSESGLRDGVRALERDVESLLSGPLFRRPEEDGKGE